MSKNEFLDSFKTDRWMQKSVVVNEGEASSVAVTTTLLFNDMDYINKLERIVDDVGWESIADINVTIVQDLFDQTKSNQIIAVRPLVSADFKMRNPKIF